MKRYKIVTVMGTECYTYGHDFTSAIAKYCADRQRGEDTIKSIELA